MTLSSVQQWLASIVLALANLSTPYLDEMKQSWQRFMHEPAVVEKRTEKLVEANKKPDTGNYSVSHENYVIPNLSLINQDDNLVSLKSLLEYGGPVMVQFIFASCSTVCPILSACFASAQNDLASISGGQYRLISISIDPEQDTPKKLTEYAQRFRAKSNWHFLTGSRNAIASVLTAFNASYQSDNKMSHQSITLMRNTPTGSWTRIEGLLSKNELVAEFKNLRGLTLQASN